MKIAAKQIVRYNDLMKMIQDILDSHKAECRNIHIDGIEVYKGQNDGANWNITRFRQSGNNHDLSECRTIIDEEICRLRESYDVDFVFRST